MDRLKLAVALTLLALCAAVPTHAQSVADNYKAKCQMCHGATGLADTPAGKAFQAHAFNSPDVMKQTDAALEGTIKAGKNKMPAFSSKLTDAQIAELVKYLRTLGK